MHTVMVIAIGFAVLAVSLILGRQFGGARAAMASAALVFLPLWLIGAGINLWIGVTRAGYSLKEEFPVFLVVFAVPAAAALALWWKLRAGP